MNARSWIARRLGRCPSGAALSRAFSEGAAPALSIHVRGCAQCLEEWRAMERVRDAAALLNAPPLGADVKNQWASRLVGSVDRASVRRPARRDWRWAPLLAGSATVALALVVGGRLPRHRASEPGAPRSAVAVHAEGAVAFARVSPPPDELLRLDDGTLGLDVTNLGPGHRVRVATGESEVELSAGKFEITAASHQLATVSVRYGHTVIRGARFEVRLNDGDQWTRSGRATGEDRGASSAGPVPGVRADTARAPRGVGTISEVVNAGAVRSPGEAPAPREAPRPRSLSSRSHISAPPLQATRELPSIPPAPPSAAATPGQRESFDRGWRLLRAGEAGQAAAAFAQVSSEPQGGAIREDALFWRGVALARAALPGEARTTLAEFVRTYRLSPRRGEAAAMLGWLYLDAHDETAARAAFEVARSDRASRVRASALCGLARLAGEPCPESP